jgi:hypothetical protein
MPASKKSPNKTKVKRRVDHKTESFKSELLGPIREILGKNYNESINKYNISIGIDLFSKFFYFGLEYSNHNYSKRMKPDSEHEKEITDLIIPNFVWMRNFLISFPRVFLTSAFEPKIVCKVRSGVEFFFNFWGDLLIKDCTLSNLFDPLGRVIGLFNSNLTKWLKDTNILLTEIPEHIPKSHWWWYISSEKSTFEKENHSKGNN